jgi:hypothetical protein
MFCDTKKARAIVTRMKENPVQPPIFVPSITNMQQLRGMFEQVVKIYNNTSNIINDTIIIATNELENRKAITDILCNNVSTEW